MWCEPYTLKEGCCIGGGLLLTGGVLQLVLGPVQWQLLSWPVNGILVALLVIAIVIAHLLRDKVYVIRYLSKAEAAVPAIAFSAVLTLIMGISSQMTMLRFWPLVLCYLWMVVILGLSTLKRLSRIRQWNRHNIIHNIAFVCNHLGLMVALVAATAGSADMMKVEMNCSIGEVEWRAMDEESHQLIELPVAIELQDFTLEQYPATVAFIDNETGKVVRDVDIPYTIDTVLDYAAPILGRYVEWRSLGATTAALVHVGDTVGWVSNGSFMFPFAGLRLNDAYSLVMPEREPKRYASTVDVFTKSGQSVSATIEVNHPLRIEGWTIYQLSYDTQMGRWSTSSVFELVRDPWLPAVYIGIAMLILGALGMFVFAANPSTIHHQPVVSLSNQPSTIN